MPLEVLSIIDGLGVLNGIRRDVGDDPEFAVNLVVVRLIAVRGATARGHKESQKQWEYAFTVHSKPPLLWWIISRVYIPIVCLE